MKILVPVDYTDHSQAVVAQAFKLAQAFAGRVRILHVWETRPKLASGVKVITPEGRSASVADLIKEDAEARMAAFLATVTPPPEIQVKTLVMSGNSADAILKEAERGKYDLIVIGTKSRSVFDRFVLGSVAENVLRMSKIPVLAVPLRADS
jgi:nucleotide-binding universal stress UspA family protein